MNNFDDEKIHSLFSEIISMNNVKENVKLKIFKYLIEIENLTSALKNVHLCKAAHFGYLEILKYFSKFVDINENDEKGNAILTHVIVSKQIQNEELRLNMLKFCIEEKNVTINHQSFKNNVTPLIIVIDGGYISLINYFLNQKNINVLIHDSQNLTAISYVIFSRGIKTEEEKILILKTFFNKGLANFDIFGGKLLQLSLYGEYFTMFQFLTNISFSYYDNAGVHFVFYIFDTPFNETKKLELLTFLIQKKKNIFHKIHSMKNNHGQTLVHKCIYLGYFQILFFLLHFPRWNVNIQDNFKNTPLHLLFYSSAENISANDKLKIIQIFVEKFQANLNLKNRVGKSLLHLACSFGDIQIISYICEINKYNINEQDFNGNTPLMHAIIGQSMYIPNILLLVRYLVNTKFANVGLKNNRNKTAFILSLEEEIFDISKFLLQKILKKHSVTTDEELFNYLLQTNFTSYELNKTQILNTLLSTKY
jgi:ankyrin repeat protein